MQTVLEAMDRRINHTTSILLVLISLTPFFNVSVAAGGTNSHQKFSTKDISLTPREYLLRYWDSHIKNNLPKPAFLLSKASPLTASEYAYLTNLANQNELASNYAFFCIKANLFCLPDPRAQIFPRGKKVTNDVGSKDSLINILGNPPGSSGSVNKGSGPVNNTNGQQFANYNMDFSHYEINKNNNGSSFANYSDETNFGLAVFKDYSKEGSGGRVTFINYTAGNGSTFAEYNGPTGPLANGSTGQQPHQPDSLRRDTTSSEPVSSLVEPGKFFREAQLKGGNVMPRPDIRDSMPRRSFLPKSIVSKLPFSSSRVQEVKKIFHAADNSTMKWVIHNALVLCEKNPSPGETRTCVGSIEDMIDFAISILGDNVVVKTTQNVNGSSTNVMIGSVKALNGVTKAVSCHQNLYPYMLYYCHSVPKVRVYEADILDVNSKQKINHGIAICHLDTSSWSPLHAAFVALGGGPGKIEVCHWIFENDMTWTWAS